METSLPDKGSPGTRHAFRGSASGAVSPTGRIGGFRLLLPHQGFHHIAQQGIPAHIPRENNIRDAREPAFRPGPPHRHAGPYLPLDPCPFHMKGLCAHIAGGNAAFGNEKTGTHRRPITLVTALGISAAMQSWSSGSPGGRFRCSGFKIGGKPFKGFPALTACRQRRTGLSTTARYAPLILPLTGSTGLAISPINENCSLDCIRIKTIKVKYFLNWLVDKPCFHS